MAGWGLGFWVLGFRGAFGFEVVQGGPVTPHPGAGGAGGGGAGLTRDPLMPLL